MSPPTLSNNSKAATMIQKLALALTLCIPTLVLAQPKLQYIYSADSIEKGITLHDEEKYEEAIRLFSMVSPGDTNYELALYEKCLSLVKAERYEEALKPINEGIAFKNSNEGMFYNLLGTSFDHLDREQEAIETYTAAIERFPMDHNLYYNRAVVYASIKEYDKQLEDLINAVEINPFHSSSHLALANIALNEEQYAQCLLAAGFFLMLEPTSQRANDLVVLLNNAVSDKVELEPKDITLAGENDFKKINLLITSYVALRNDYKIPADITIPFTKQLHIAIEQSVKIKKRTGFWQNYYLPFYDIIMEDDRFEPFVYRLLLSSGNEKHQKIFSKNVKDIKAFTNYIGPEIKRIYGEHHLKYDENNETLKYWFADAGQNLEAVGKVTGDNTPTGPYTFYYNNGAISSEGAFNNKGERDGEWTYYYPDGRKSGINNYVDGEFNGADIDYHENGLKSVESTFKDGERHGITCVYRVSGVLDRCMFHSKGVIEDSIVYYHENGKVDRWLPIKAGLIEGKALYYRADGTLMATMEWANDQRHGDFEFYFPDGKVSSKGTYKEGSLDGAYVSYYPNENIESKGNYIDGIKVGRWEEFFYDGKKKEISNYDEKGKNNGSMESFDYNGHPTMTLEYNRGEITTYKHFGRDGSIIHQDERKRGRFWYESYTLDGVKDIEGNYEGDHKEGLWKYYTDNGVLISEETYDDEGNIDGEDRDYHRNGEIASIMKYENGTLTGYEVSYHKNGQMSEQGYNQNGLAQGRWESYYPDGKLRSSTFYVDDTYNGPQYFYSEVGELYMIEYFKNGTMIKTESTNADSSVYKVSEMKLPVGADIRYYPNGQKVYDMPTAGNKYHGTAQWWYGNGQLTVKGDYLAGQRHGVWTWYNPQGKITEQGEYLFGQKTGEWKEFHTNGKVASVVSFENGEEHGEHIYYYPDGKLETRTTYFQGEMNGKRYFYDYNGKVDHIRFYDQGRIIGYSYLDNAGNEKEMIPIERETGEITSYFANGKVSRKYKLNKGMFEGEYLEYNDDGSIRFSCNYVDDEREGECLYYFKTGKLKTRYMYKNGVVHGESTEYHSNGKVRKKTNYANGAAHGITEIYDENGKLLHKYEYNGGELYEEI